MDSNASNENNASSVSNTEYAFIAATHRKMYEQARVSVWASLQHFSSEMLPLLLMRLRLEPCAQLRVLLLRALPLQATGGGSSGEAVAKRVWRVLSQMVSAESLCAVVLRVCTKLALLQPRLFPRLCKLLLPGVWRSSYAWQAAPLEHKLARAACVRDVCVALPTKGCQLISGG